jgi:hypothetical protein
MIMLCTDKPREKIIISCNVESMGKMLEKYQKTPVGGPRIKIEMKATASA